MKIKEIMEFNEKAKKFVLDNNEMIKDKEWRKCVRNIENLPTPIIIGKSYAGSGSKCYECNKPSNKGTIFFKYHRECKRYCEKCFNTEILTSLNELEFVLNYLKQKITFQNEMVDKYKDKIREHNVIQAL